MHSSSLSLTANASPRGATPSEQPSEDALILEEPTAERGTLKLTLDFSSLFESEQVSDVVLDLEGAGGEALALPAHRVVLVAASTYFSSLFSGAWDQQHEGRDGPKHVRVASEERLSHLRLFFAFLYGVDVELDLVRAHPLLRLADFYGVDALMSQCLAFLERTLHPQPTRCFTLFETHAGGGEGEGADAPLDMPPQERLIALCSEVLARSFAEASAHSSFCRCPFELLSSVLERDDLSVDKEEEVLRALLLWAQHDAPRRAGSALVRLLELVRWPLMDGARLAEIEESHPLLTSSSSGGGGTLSGTSPPPPDVADALRALLLEAFKYQAASEERRTAVLDAALEADANAARRLRPRTPNMVRLQGEGKFGWSLKNFSRLAADERIYSPPFVYAYAGIAFMLLFFPRGNQQREYASLYVSVADKTKLPAGWRRSIHFSLSVIDQRESLCSVTKSTHGELTTQVLDWGFTELLPLATLHSSNHGYVLHDALQFTIEFMPVCRTSGGSSA